MAIIVTTADPRGLVAAIKSGIDANDIKSWGYDSDGDFSHVGAEWIARAWLRPSYQVNEVVFKILTPKSSTMSKPTYGLYHGRFIEMLLTHFDLQFSRAVASAMPERGDIIKDES